MYKKSKALHLRTLNVEVQKVVEKKNRNLTNKIPIIKETNFEDNNENKSLNSRRKIQQILKRKLEHSLKETQPSV